MLIIKEKYTFILNNEEKKDFIKELSNGNRKLFDTIEDLNNYLDQNNIKNYETIYLDWDKLC